MSLTSRLRVINNVLLVLAFVLAVLVVWELVRYGDRTSLSLPAIVSLEQQMYTVEETSVPPFSTYEPIFASRDLFAPLVKPPAPPRPVSRSRVKKVKKQSLSTVARGLSVRGIITGADGLKAFIYDDRTRSKELFQEGEKVRGIMIESITTDGVVLVRNEEKITLPY